MEAKPKKIKPKGIKIWFFIFLNLLIDLMPKNIGKTTACKWARNNRKKNKFFKYPQLILNLNLIWRFKLS